VDVAWSSVESQAQTILEQLSRENQSVFETVVGLYFQQSPRTPGEVGGNVVLSLDWQWQQDLRRIDELEKNPQLEVGQWVLPQLVDPHFEWFIRQVADSGLPSLEAAIRTWGREQPDRVPGVLERAGWWRYHPMIPRPDFDVMDGILKMPDGEERTQLLARARAESPRFYQHCLANVLFCGV